MTENFNFKISETKRGQKSLDDRKFKRTQEQNVQ